MRRRYKYHLQENHVLLFLAEREKGAIVPQFVRMVQMRGADEMTTEAYATRCKPAASLGSALGNIGFPEADELLSRIGKW